MNKVFVTSDGKKVKGKRLSEAFGKVADFWAANAKAIRAANLYADHVTEETKEENLRRQLATAEKIREGTEPMCFWLWQRINTQITGKCVAFFAGVK